MIGLPARYVSGYLQGESDASQATHAWVEVWLGKWIGIDVTNKKLVDEKFLSLAIGADYLSIAPLGALDKEVETSICMSKYLFRNR